MASQAGEGSYGTLQRWGPFALALFLLATSRWGAFLLPGPPYLVDILLGLILADRAFAAVTGRVVHRGVDSWLALSAAALLGWALILLAFSPLTQNALRDAAPYVYAVLIFAVAPLAAGKERAASRAITAVLVFHALWATPTALGWQIPWTPLLPGGEVHLFEGRPDIDSTVFGLLAALSLHRALLGRAPLFNLALAGWGAWLVLSSFTRAGLVALVVQLVVVVALSPARGRIMGAARSLIARRTVMRSAAMRRRRAHALVVALLVLAAPAGLLAAGGTQAVERVTQTEEEVQAKAGTANARLNAWERLVDWITDDATRTVAGVGMGPDFLRLSGADVLLLGERGERLTESRHPHSFFLNTWARLGLIGLALALAVVAAGIRLAYLVASRAEKLRDSEVLAILIVISIPFTAAFGVIIESPFGAIPFFWALGYLSARAVELRATVSLAELIGPGRPAVRRPGSA